MGSPGAARGGVYAQNVKAYNLPHPQQPAPRARRANKQHTALKPYPPQTISRITPPAQFESACWMSFSLARVAWNMQHGYHRYTAWPLEKHIQSHTPCHHVSHHTLNSRVTRHSAGSHLAGNAPRTYATPQSVVGPQPSWAVMHAQGPTPRDKIHARGRLHKWCWHRPPGGQGAQMAVTRIPLSTSR